MKSQLTSDELIEAAKVAYEADAMTRRIVAKSFDELDPVQIYRWVQIAAAVEAHVLSHVIAKLDSDPVPSSPMPTVPETPEANRRLSEIPPMTFAVAVYAAQFEITKK